MAVQRNAARRRGIRWLFRAGACGAWLGLAACAQIPELAATVTEDLRDSDYPALRPIDLVVAPLPAPQDEAEKLDAELAGRRDRLKRRAAALLEDDQAG